MGNTVASHKVPGSSPAQPLSVWSLHVHPVSELVSPRVQRHAG